MTVLLILITYWPSNVLYGLFLELGRKPEYPEKNTRASRVVSPCASVKLYIFRQ